MKAREASLISLQQQFIGMLLQDDRQIASRIIGTRKVPIETRLNIYAEAYHVRLIEALADSYPALHSLLGDDAFTAMSQDYLRQHPSRHFSIRWFGDRLAAFLRRSALYSGKPVLAEMALFEWTLREVFDAADFAPLDRSQLLQLPAASWAGLRVALNPTIRRIELKWNVPALWRAIEQQQEPVEAAAHEWPQPWLCWRKLDQRNWFRSMDADEAWALDEMSRGAGFADICAGLCEWIDAQHAPARAAGHISRWCDEQLLTAVLA
jgi:hypothetical protein